MACADWHRFTEGDCFTSKRMDWSTSDFGKDSVELRDSSRGFLLSNGAIDLGPVHTAPFSFPSAFVDENGVRSHCSVFK